jgi:hypothetical protein
MSAERKYFDFVEKQHKKALHNLYFSVSGYGAYPVSSGGKVAGT